MAGVPNITEIRMKLNVEVATVLHLVEWNVMSPQRGTEKG
jgi:hypothetical protein